MPTLYDIAHYVAWNGYAEDMVPYLGVDKAALENQEFNFPYIVNFRHGEHKKTRIQRICEKMTNNPRYPKRIKKLLELGAKPLPDANGWSALLECSRNPWKQYREIAEILIDAGADINQLSDGWTPLYLASYNNNIPIVNLLLSKGADINIGPRSPLSAAVTMGNLEIVKILISKGALVTDTIYKEAIYAGQIAVIKYLGTIRPVPADSIAYAMEHNVSTVLILAKLGADVNYVVNGETLVEKYIWSDDLKILLKAGADPNRTARNVSPPIFNAIYVNNLEILKLLCEKGNVNMLYDDGDYLRTPLHLAISLNALHKAENAREYMEILKFLIKKSDLTIKDWSGDTALEAARYRKIDDVVMMITRALLKGKHHNVKC